MHSPLVMLYANSVFYWMYRAEGQTKRKGAIQIFFPQKMALVFQSFRVEVSWDFGIIF